MVQIVGCLLTKLKSLSSIHNTAKKKKKKVKPNFIKHILTHKEITLSTPWHVCVWIFEDKKPLGGFDIKILINEYIN
jgi:hypothetical protein